MVSPDRAPVDKSQMWSNKNIVQVYSLREHTCSRTKQFIGGGGFALWCLNRSATFARFFEALKSRYNGLRMFVCFAVKHTSDN